MTGQASPLLRVLRGETLWPPPVWLMRQAGRYLPEYRALRAKADGFVAFCMTPELASEATLQPVRRFGLDAAILFSDILTIPAALGRTVEFVEPGGPRLEPIDGPEAIDALATGSIKARLEPVFEAVRRVRRALPDQVALIGFAGGPWTVACYMVEGHGSPDFAATRLFAYRQPAAFGRLVGRLVEATAEALSAQIDAGAQAVQIFDSWAGLLPDEEFRRWVIEPTRALVKALKEAHPEVPVIGFPRGAGLRYPGFQAATGVDAVGLDTTVSLAAAAREFSRDIPLQGNLDPLALLAGGPALDERIEAVALALRGRPHVFNLGHGVLPATPPEHVARLVERLRSLA